MAARTVTRTTLRNLGAHKVRLLLSTIAVLLGVSFVTGTFMFTDTLQSTFNSVFGQSAPDVVVTPAQAFTTNLGSGAGSQAASLPASVVDTVRAVPGVKSANGAVQTPGVTLIAADNKPVGSVGAPTFGLGWSTDRADSVLQLVQGVGPTRSSEVAIDSQSFTKGNFRIGSTVHIVTPTTPVTATIVGVFKYGSSGNLAGASLTAFDMATAQRLLLKPGQFSSIRVYADSGVSEQVLAPRVAAAVGPDYTVKTGKQATDDATAQIKSALGFINGFLLVFAFIALVVGAFIILNTFTMLVAQRARELALLRALGASRRQVTASVMGEAIAVGIVGAALGLLLGVLIAFGLHALLSAVGVDLPSGGLIIKPRTIVVAVVVGVVVTLVAAYLPARRAAKVPPVAAMRDDVGLPAKSLRRRTIIGAVAVGIGVICLVIVDAGSGDRPVSLVGIGALLLFGGVVTLAPWLGGWLSRAIGTPFRRGPVGRMAVDNARRNPRRTAATASALMVGLALVTAFGILGTSTKASVGETLDQVNNADFIISSTSQALFSPEVAASVAKVPGVQTTSQVGEMPAQFNGKTTSLTTIQPDTVFDVVNLEVVAGSASALTTDAFGTDDKTASKNHWTVGQKVPITFLTGQRQVALVMIYKGESGFTGSVISRAYALTVGGTDQDVNVFVKLAPGTTTDEVRPAIEKALEPFPTVQLQDQAEYKASISNSINGLLALIYGLLALAVVIAVLGIVNTLALSVVERTREIGLLRAVGMSRRQLRRMIRIESVVVAVFGAVLGIVVGLAVGITFQRSLASQGINVLRVPIVQLLIFLVIAALVGVLAAIWPARRAAKLDVLRAITTE